MASSLLGVHPTMDDTLQTARCLLRAPRPGDAAAAWALWGQDAEVWRHLAWPQPRDEATLRQQLDYLASLQRKGRAWIWLLCLQTAPQSPIGLLQLLPGGPEAPPHHLRLGFQLARAHWGRGLMREAAAAVLAHAFTRPGLWRVDALCDVDNHPSERLLLVLGMVREGLLRRHTVHPALGPAPRDVWMMALTRDAASPAAT
jgi:ribosomal-protein-alanine N-acetyltransferase